MSSSDAHQLAGREVIDLVSDSDDDETQEVKLEQDVQPPLNDVSAAALPTAVAYQPPAEAQGTADAPFEGEVGQRHDDRLGYYINIDGEEVFIPDEELEGQSEAPQTLRIPQRVKATEGNHVEAAVAHAHQDVTSDSCLQRVLDIFPDISHEYVLKLYNDFNQEGEYETLPGHARLDNIIEQLVSAPSYPKQEKGKKVLKRKHEESVEEDQVKKWQQADRALVPRFLKGPMQSMLKAEFPDIPVVFINGTLATEKHLFQAFVSLSKAKDNNDGSERPYGRGRPSTKNLAAADTIATNCGWPEMLDELNAARTHVQAIRAERAAEVVKNLQEKENLQRAIEAGQTAECSACFDDLPMNRQIHCDGPNAHFTCFDCALTYVKSEVGESRCGVLCTAGCGASFASSQLNLLCDKQLLEKLYQLQQEKDIRDAGLEDLEECPFCDYKAIAPPIDEDFEFRCANPDCEKVSCRRCKSVSHIPISCEQHAKENKVNSRHKIEEAMTAAMIRSCNRCQRNFIKDYGCNKMTCPSCKNVQCYVCSVSVQDYNHFDQSGKSSKMCPLYDNVEDRHEREVKEAERLARAQVAEENPDVSAEDLDIKVSDAVKKSSASRIRQARGGPEAGLQINNLWGMMGDGAADDDDFFGIDNGALEEDRRHRQRRLALAELQMQRIRQRRPDLAVDAPRERPRAAVAARTQAPNHVQGYIPVLGFQPPVPLPARPGAQANVVPPPQPIQPGQFPQHPLFGPPLPTPPRRDLYNPFGGFGGDAALDNNHLPHLAPQIHNHQPTFLPAAAAAAAQGYGNPHTAPLGLQAEARRDFHGQLEALRQQHDRLIRQQRQRREQWQQEERNMRQDQ